MLDFDIIQIEVNQTRQGIGTQFVVNLIEASSRLGRGVFLEQTITAQSRGWAQRLISMNLMKPYTVRGTDYVVEDNFISV